MYGKNEGNLWTIKGATLIDKSTRKEYNLTQDEILEGINQGKLHYRVNYTSTGHDLRFSKPIKTANKYFVSFVKVILCPLSIYIYGNPWFRLIRIEVEKFAEEMHRVKHL